MPCFKRFIAWVLISSAIFGFTSCGDRGMTEKTLFAMDTLITFKASGTTESLIEECEDRIAGIECEISKNRDESDIYIFNTSVESVELGEDPKELITRILELCVSTDGAYDPTVATLTELWDITGKARVPSQSEIAEALLHVGYETLTLEENVLTKADREVKLDLGGAGKGYACEQVIDILSESGGYGLVSFGSSIGVYGEKPEGEAWNIAITDPYEPSSAIGYVTIYGGYISVSGDYERYAEIDGVRYSHIIDPETGYPVSNGVHSAVIYSDDAVVGDILSTALMVAGEEEIEQFKQAGIEFEALVISDRGYTMTDGMKKILTLYEEKK